MRSRSERGAGIRRTRGGERESEGGENRGT